MRRSVSVRILTALALVGLLQDSSARAEDTKGKWQFGFGLTYFSTIDYIRSNADLAFASTLAGSGGLPQVGNVDPRPDINIVNQPSIADDFKLDLNASYGLTRWLAVELATSYQQSAVGNIEYYSSDATQPLNSPVPGDANHAICGPDQAQVCGSYTQSLQVTKVTNDFLQVGQITEMPVQLSGLVRFRPESPFDPYLGLGVGYIFTRMKEAGEFKDTSARLAALRVSTASEGEYTSDSLTTRIDTCSDPPCPGFVPKPLEATVRNSFEWHAVGGVDYYVNDHFSFYIDARYVWTSGSLDIRTDGAHQVQFGVADNGQLLLKKRLYAGPSDPVTGDGDPNNGPYLWEDVGLRNPNLLPKIGDTPADPGYGQSIAGCSYFDPRKNRMVDCAGDGLFETEDKNLNGLLDARPEFSVTDPKCVSPGYDLGHHTEDDGCIYVFPPGPMPTISVPGVGPVFDPSSRFDDLTFICTACQGNDTLHKDANPPLRMSPDSEDLNYNVFMDRFLKFGVDICTTALGVGDPRCINNNSHYDPSQPPTYVFPESCSLNRPDPLAPPLKGEGCPPPLTPDNKSLPSTSGADNVSDVYLVQGGRIHLGGFGLGFGFKFTF